jgi:hypothetical protein
VAERNGSPHLNSRSCMSSIRSSIATTRRGHSASVTGTGLSGAAICAGEMPPGRGVHPARRPFRMSAMVNTPAATAREPEGRAALFLRHLRWSV